LGRPLLLARRPRRLDSSSLGERPLDEAINCFIARPAAASLSRALIGGGGSGSSGGQDERRSPSASQSSRAATTALPT